MGLTEALSRAAASRAHVLVAEAPGSFRERAALERAIDANGWCIADAVADADVLAVVGEPGPELAAIIDHVWGQMSEPKVLIDIRDGASVAAGLVEARDALRDPARQHAQAAQRNDSPPAQHDDEHDQPADGHEGHDDGGHEGHGDGGHDHGAMAPDGIPLAEGAEDRDGLEMDELHLPLGPVLAHWPAGVVLRLTLHGDVVAEAEVERLDAHAATTLDTDGLIRAARLLDAAASVLLLAGLPADAARGRRLRDLCLSGSPVVAETIDALAGRVRRSRVLRWLLSGLVRTREDGRTEELHARLVDLVERARAAVDGVPLSDDLVGPELEAVPELMRGQELAAVRLWMAALSPDLTGAAAEEAAHG